MNNKQTLCTLYLATALMACSLTNASEMPAIEKPAIYANILARFDNILLYRLDTILAKLNEKKPLPWITRLDRLLIGLGKTGLKAVGTVLCHPVASTAIFVTVCAAIPSVRRTVFPRLNSAIKTGLTSCYTRFATNYPDNPLVRAVNFFKPDREHERAAREQALIATQQATQELRARIEQLAGDNRELRNNLAQTAERLAIIQQLETNVREQGQSLHAINEQMPILLRHTEAIPGLQAMATEQGQHLQVARQQLGSISETLQRLRLASQPHPIVLSTNPGLLGINVRADQ